MAYWEWNQTGDSAHPRVIVCVHGLTRQGRDFDVLAQTLSRQARVICPDVVGRGRSDWLADPMAYGLPQYAADMQALLRQLQAQQPMAELDWVGTSMGGLIGMLLAGGAELPVPIRRLVLNDVGPSIEWAALQRIGSYVGQGMEFSSVPQAVEALRLLSAGFGPHSASQWLALSLPQLRHLPAGRVVLHYDPAIALAFQGLTQEQARQGEALMWALYDRIEARTLVLRGADSDLLSPATADAMTRRGPHAAHIVLENVGHAPTLVDSAQVALVRNFLLGDE